MPANSHCTPFIKKSPPLTPRKNLHGLPPTYLAHLRALLHQWLQYQLAPPDEGLPGPSSRPAAPTPLWSDERLAAIEEAVWSVIVKHAQGDQQGLLGCDWEAWAKGSHLRKRAWKGEEDARAKPKKVSDQFDDKLTERSSVPKPAEVEGTIRGLGFKLPIPSAISSAVSTPTKGTTQPASAASSVRSHSRERSGGDAAADSTDPGDARRFGGLDQRDDWARVIRSLQGYLPLDEPNREVWEMLNDDQPSRTPIREVPGAFPQASSSISYFNSLSQGSSLPPSAPLPAPLPDMLKPLICLSFQPASPGPTAGSTRSQSTVRFARESSAGAESSHSGGTAGPSSNTGSTGMKERSGSISGWLSNKWSEMTVSPEGKVEMDFIPGRFALPLPRERGGIRRKRSSVDKGRGRSSAGQATMSESSKVETDTEDSDSGWSGTETGHEKQQDRAENLLVLGKELDVPLEAAQRGEIGLVGGTVVIRGIRKEEERQAIKSIFAAVIYAIQCHILELSLLDAFSIPREADPPPAVPAKPFVQRTRTFSTPRPASPTLNRANSQGSGLKKGFLAKLGKEGKGMWDGLIGKRRGSGAGTITSDPAPRGRSEAEDQAEVARAVESQSRDSVTYARSGTNPILTPTPPSITTAETLSLAPPATLSHATSPSRPHPISSIERHLQILTQIREMRHSTTPDLTFPLPPILLRIEEEDRIRRQKADEEVRAERREYNSRSGIDGLPVDIGTGSMLSTATGPTSSTQLDPLRARPTAAAAYRLGGDVRAGLGSLASSLDGWEGWWRLQKMEFLYWTGVEDGQNPRSGSDDLIPNSAPDTPVLSGSMEKGLHRPTRATSEKNHIAGPDQARTGTRNPEIIACTKPTASSHRFNEPGSDQSIEEYFAGLADEMGFSTSVPPDPNSEPQAPSTDDQMPKEVQADLLAVNTTKVRRESDESRSSDESGSWEAVCPRSSCGVAERDHIRIWASGGRRIMGRTSKVADAGIQDRKDGLNLVVSVQCRVCEKRGPAREIGSAGKYSWNKFLELLLHTRILINADRCHHGHPQDQISNSRPADVDYILSSSTISLRLSPEDQPILDVRLPKLQVGPNVAKRKIGPEAARAAADVFMPKLDKPLPDSVGEAAGSSQTTGTTLHTDSAALVDDAMPQTSRPQIEAEDDGLHPPGSSTFIRVEEPASVIAYVLSSQAYFAELCGGHQAPDTVPSTATSTVDGTATVSGSGTTAGWTIEVKRRDTPRDILPLRTLTKKRSEISLPSARLPLPLSVTPKQPSAELNLAPVTARLDAGGREGMGDLVKSISKATAQDPVLHAISASSTPIITAHPVPPSPSISPLPGTDIPHIDGSVLGLPARSEASLSESEISDNQPKRALMPRPRRRLTDDAPPSSFRRAVSASISVNSSPRLPSTPKLTYGTPPRSVSSRGKEHSRSPSVSSAAKEASTDAGAEGWGSVTSSFASSFNTLVRFGTDVTDSLTARVRSVPENSRSLAALMGPFGLPGPHSDGAHTPSTSGTGPAAMTTHDDRPHIQLNLSGPSHKISCTVYFAAAFDTLRRRCAFDRSVVRSLEHTVGWVAEGGKSKASFWKTADERLVVKSLVSKWNVSDLQALLEIAPAYFEHMGHTHNKATSLAKIVGFYSVKIHDLKTNEKSSMDLLVMENLFHQQHVARQFDLKGIEGRKVPKGKEGNSTLFDAEWLEAQATSPFFIHPHAKRILLDSLANDTRFLSSQSIMDYSLLLGLDEAHKQLVVGLVDAVGSYSLFKNIESMGKMALNRGREGEVTIIPPDQYRERFETALRSYFIACPDKWSRTVAAKRIHASAEDIPCIF